MDGRQEVLLEMPEQPESGKSSEPEKPRGAPRFRPIDREQALMRVVIVDELVSEDHKARAIWELTGQLELSEFLESVGSREGRAGRPGWDVRLLLSVWLYAYSERVGSARQVERLMEYEPGLMWLSGLGEVNYHVLSDFRTEHEEALKQLLADLLGLLSKAGLVKLECVAHDGTKIRAQAAADTFRREATLEQEIERARAAVEEVSLQQDSGDGGEARRQAARRRVAVERSERLQEAVGELKKIRAGKKGEQREKARVSLSEPEARIMKDGRQAMGPAYNVQLSTDMEAGIVVGVRVTQEASDSRELAPAMEEVRSVMGRYPERVVADGGFTNQASIAAMEEKKIDFYGSLPSPEQQQAGAMKAAGIDPAFAPALFTILKENNTLRCPAGQTLKYVRRSHKRGQVYRQYQASGGDCSRCEFRTKCCPKRVDKGRVVSVRVTENPRVVAFRKKMETAEARAIYRQRGAAAEFPNAWIKEKLGMRKFRLRGLRKIGIEALWGVLTYDVQQWIRLIWRKPQEVSAAVALAS